ncbi:hypothetical protein DM02DRAFT_188069 [Periconia macrospinosa]|uniref:Uncharacterized protein n=1 Tax=Periconia macrospinosa TaxID=97972 RepID=A0A2V1E1I2_9PLEO|nr:hypothetical protein DM02DRAFT_188069 [Periconia macrospinosa]
MLSNHLPGASCTVNNNNVAHQRAGGWIWWLRRAAENSRGDQTSAGRARPFAGHGNLPSIMSLYVVVACAFRACVVAYVTYLGRI